MMRFKSTFLVYKKESGQEGMERSLPTLLVQNCFAFNATFFCLRQRILGPVWHGDSYLPVFDFLLIYFRITLIALGKKTTHALSNSFSFLSAILFFIYRSVSYCNGNKEMPRFSFLNVIDHFLKRLLYFTGFVLQNRSRN